MTTSPDLETTLAPDPRTYAHTRRARLVERLVAARLDAALITDPREICYLIAAPLATPSSVPSCLLVRSSGESTLVCGETTAPHHVEHLVTFPWHRGGTIFTELIPALVSHAAPKFHLENARVGVQAESITAQLVAGSRCTRTVPIDAILFDLERSKDELDIHRIRNAITANLAAFEAARNTIVAGATELEVFAAATRGAMLSAGEKIVHDGDYRCNAPGGPCRNVKITSGDLYIVDAWTQRAGYWSDLARVYPVGPPSTEQVQLIEHVRGVHDRIRPMLRPGTTGHELWAEMDAELRRHPAIRHSGLVHHGGHGVGLRLHEVPDINPGVTDALRRGDVVCLEPGAYTSFGNVRIEETYLITDQGAECLSGK